MNAISAINDCSTYTSDECGVVKEYGWPVNNWCFYDDLTDMSSLFKDNPNFDDDISGWDVSRVTNMYEMFRGATAFNQDIGGWDVSRVANMQNMFNNAAAFNQDISGWTTERVTTMYGMFYYAEQFNQDISGWTVSSVTDMRFMFQYATSFNQDLSEWDVSRVTTMTEMFVYATSFNQDLCYWRDNFPYESSSEIFTDSACTFKTTPNSNSKGPFCKSECGHADIDIGNPGIAGSSEDIGDSIVVKGEGSGACPLNLYNHLCFSFR